MFLLKNNGQKFFKLSVRVFHQKITVKINLKNNGQKFFKNFIRSTSGSFLAGSRMGSQRRSQKFLSGGFQKILYEKNLEGEFSCFFLKNPIKIRNFSSKQGDFSPNGYAPVGSEQFKKYLDSSSFAKYTSHKQKQRNEKA